MKRNVVLFSLLGIGVLYLFFGAEEEHAPTEKLPLESETETPTDEPALFHTRKLLSFENSDHQVDSIRTLSGSVIKDYKFEKREQLGKSRSLGVRSKKLVRRRKRNVPHPEQYAWKFNLNVTRRDSNDTSNKPDYPIQNDGIPEDNRHLGMAMSVSGNGPQESVGDLYQAWDSVGQFLRTLFGGSFDELKDKGHEVSLDISPLPNGSIQVPHELFLEGSGEEDSQELRNRRGKFLLGIFGFGGNKENPPRDEGSGEMQEFINTESVAQEFLNSTVTFSERKTADVLEIVTTEASGAFSTRSGLLGRSFNENNFETTKFTLTNSNSEETFMIGNCTDCDYQTEPFVATEKKVFEPIPTLQPIDFSTISEQFPLSDETVKAFCVALFSRMRTSGRSVEESEGSGNLENLVSDATASNVLTDNPISQNIGFFESIWNRIIGRRNAVGVEEPSKDSRKARLIRFGNLFGGSGRSVDLEESSNANLEEFKDDFNNIEDSEQFLFDCEEFLRSTHTETRPNIFDLVDPHFPESLTTELTTLSDDKFQIEEQDIDDLTKKINSHIESTTDNEVFTILSTISKNIDEQTPNIMYYTHPTDYQNKHFEKEKETTVLEMTELVYTEAYEKEPSNLSVQNLVRENVTATGEIDDIENVTATEEIEDIENVTATEEIEDIENVTATEEIEDIENVTATEEIEAPEKILRNSIPTNLPEETALTTKEYNANPNEERSFNLFGFGSGRDDGSSDISNIEERIFGFGSGGREITENEVSTEDILDKTTESSKERSFGIFNLFGSGERAIEEEVLSTDQSAGPETRVPFSIDFGSGARELVNLKGSGNEDNNLTSTIANDGRIFGFLGFGSGERGFPETSELETERELLFSTTKGSNADGIPSFVTSEFSVEISEQRLRSTNVPLDETKDERSLNFNIFGSGDGRILTETEDLADKVTSETSIIKNVDGNSSIIELCSDCEETIFPSMEESTVEVSRVGEMSSTDSSNDNEGKIPRNGFEVTTNEARPLFTPKDEDCDTDTEVSLETTTQQDKSRLFNTIFLTGSGEGGLFVDNKGPINLVQEIEFTPPPSFQPPVQPRRGARRHDEPLVFPVEKVPQTTKVATVESTTEIMNFTEFQNTTDSSDLEKFVTDADNETEVDLPLPEIEDDNWKVTFDLSTPAAESESPEVSVPSTTESITLDTSSTIDTPNSTIVTSPKIDTTTSMVISTSPKIKQRTKFIELPQRVCTSASQCNRTLNERCMSNGPTAMCNCGRSYVRSPETGKCEAPVLLTTSLKLPGEAYHEDLKNKNSPRFRKLANDSIETMWILLGDDPEVFRLVAGVDVSGFEKGSLVVHWEIMLAAPPNESVAALIQQVDAELKEAFEDEDLLKRAPLNVQDAIVVGVTNDVNPCEKTELNYCSINANCIRDPMRGFKCHCKDDFEDKSTDKNHPGEICTAKCPAYYCGDHGECKLKQNGEFHCSCNSWYFGERCEISGIVVIASFASFNALLIILVLLLVCYCRKRRYRQSQFYGQNQVRFQPESELGRFTASPRLADTIAMNDVGPTKASKYMSISTPMHNTPNIRLTSPSILGSSVDYDYDSTFDRTPSVKDVNVEVHKSGSSPKV